MNKVNEPHYSSELQDKEFLLILWLKSTETMHKAHHTAANKYTKQHRSLGILSTTLSTLIATSLFISLSSSKSQIVIIGAGLVSMLAAAVTGIFTFLNKQETASQHYKAVIKFQAVRR